MSIEAMKQALQALDLIDKDIEWHDKSPTRKFCNQAAHFLRQAIAEAEKQEPVVGTKTWFEDGKMVTQHLYASDISQERVDETTKREHELAGTIPISNGGIATRTPSSFISPPKREWVGLTDEEAKKTFEEHNCVISADLAGILARAIEAKSKEKNT